MGISVAVEAGEFGELPACAPKAAHGAPPSSRTSEGAGAQCGWYVYDRGAFTCSEEEDEWDDAADDGEGSSAELPPASDDPATLASSAASFEHMVRSVWRLEAASSGGSDVMEHSLRSFAR